MMVPLDPAPGSTGDPGTPPGPAASPPRLGGARRALATIALTAGLLTVGGVSVVMAASPDPSASAARAVGILCRSHPVRPLPQSEHSGA